MLSYNLISSPVFIDVWCSVEKKENNREKKKSKSEIYEIYKNIKVFLKIFCLFVCKKFCN